MSTFETMTESFESRLVENIVIVNLKGQAGRRILRPVGRQRRRFDLEADEVRARPRRERFFFLFAGPRPETVMPTESGRHKAGPRVPSTTPCRVICPRLSWSSAITSSRRL